MVRAVGKLSPTKMTALVRAGSRDTHSDGGNLYLQVTGPGTASWLFRYTVRGTGSAGGKQKMRYLGLGPIHTVGLADARLKAKEMRQQLLDGIDPGVQRLQAKDAALSALSFDEVAELYIKAHEASWRSSIHARQWRASLQNYVSPVVGSLPVAVIGTAEVMQVLDPIWRTKSETASRVRQRIESVLDYAQARNWRRGDNPARWRGHLANLLPPKEKVAPVQHHPAMGSAAVPEFMRMLAGRQGMAAKTLTFLILTAGRSAEVRHATWAEIDLAGATWTVPAARTKAAREHRVPLAEQALAVLRSIRPDAPEPDVLLFPGAKIGRPLSDVALAKLLPPETTCHGFRATFRTWAGETTGYPREVVEMALAHRLGDAVEQAYARGDLFQRRRQLMIDWASFCCGAAATDKSAEKRTG
jgi:integrase